MANSIEPKTKCNIKWRCNALKIKKVVFDTLADFQYLPSELELSLISSLAYDDLSKATMESQTTELNSKDWMEIVVGKHKSGYRGVGYFNTKSGQLVIAHKGTTMTWNDWISDAALYSKSSNAQVIPAYNFTNEIVRKLGTKSTSIVITGHSLGGWLAQITGFLIQYPQCAGKVIGIENMNQTAESIQHIHVVAFDPPGAYGAISKYHKERYPEPETMLHNRLNYFDCVVYLCEVNPINTVVDKHFGFVFKMSGVEKHKMRFIIDFWRKDENKLYVIRDWPYGLRSFNPFGNGERVELREPDTNTIRISYFSPSEIDLLHDLSIMAKKKNVEWGRVISDCVKDLDIDYEIFEKFAFGNLRLNLKVACDLNNFVQTFKFIHNKIETGMFFQDNQTVHKAIWLGYSESYDQSILKLKDNHTSIPNMEQIETLIKNQLENLEKPECYQVQSKSPIVCVSAIHHRCEKYSKNICFIDSTSLNAIAKNFPGVVKQAFPSGAVFVIQLNSEFKEADYLFRHDSNIAIVIITKSNSAKLCREVFEFSPPLHFSSLLDQSKDQILNKIVLFQDIPVTVRSIVGSAGLDNIELNDYCELLEGEVLRIGNKLPSLNEFLRSYYIKRKFYTNIFSNFDLEKIKERENGKYHVKTDLYFLSRSEDNRNEGEVELLNQEEVELLKDILSLKSAMNDNLGIFNQSEEKHAELVEKMHLFHERRNKKRRNAKHGSDHFFKTKDLSTITITYQIRVSRFWESNCPSGNWLLNNLDLGRGRPILIFENNGNMHSVNGHQLVEVVTDSSNTIHEEDLHQNLVFGVRVIVGEPGMGKSTFLVNFVEALRESHKFIFHFNLNTCTNILSNFENSEYKHKSIPRDKLVEFFCSMFEQNSDLINPSYVLLMKNALENSVILMDGYDEISEEAQNKLHFLISYLKDFSPIIYIFSRLRERTKLEAHLNVCAIRPVPLDKNEQTLFLRKFWSNNYEVKNSDHPNKDEIIKKYSDQLIQKFTQGFLISETVMGIPLQLFMLATVALPRLMKRFNNEAIEEESVFLSVFQVIEEFVLEKYRIMFEEKEGLGRDFSQNKSYTYKTQIEKYNKIHSKQSFAYLFPNEFVEITGLKLNKAVTEEDLLTIQRIGIIYQVEWDNECIILEAIHRLFLEYFSAEFIVRNLRKENNRKQIKQIQFLKKNFSQKPFDQIRLALDYLLSSESEILRQIVLRNPVLDQSRFAARKILETSDTDLLGRNIMHYLMSYAFEHITITQMELKEEFRLNLKTDQQDSIDVSPLNYILFNLKEEYYKNCLPIYDIGLFIQNNSIRGFSNANTVFICNRLLMNDYTSLYTFIVEIHRLNKVKCDIYEFAKYLKTHINQLPESEDKERCKNEYSRRLNGIIIRKRLLRPFKNFRFY